MIGQLSARCRVSRDFQAKKIKVVASRSTHNLVRTMATKDLAPVYLKLQNGSDVRGIALDTVPTEPINLTPISAYFIGQAFAQWVAKQKGVDVKTLKFAIGSDPRLTADSLMNSISCGIGTLGASIAITGMSTTPAMFFTTIMKGTTGVVYDGSMMVTASHMPSNRNGIKFFMNTGGLNKKDITAILQSAAELAGAADVDMSNTGYDYITTQMAGISNKDTVITKDHFLPLYSAMLRDMIVSQVKGAKDAAKPLDGFHIVVDAGNGGGGFIATDVLEPLGCNIKGSQFIDPDGTFPNHMPNPEDKQAMAAGVDMVLKSGAELGIVFDTDVDRSAIVSSDGKAINSNRMIALMAAIVLEDHPGTTVVTDSVTSNGLARFIASLGGKHYRYKRGYRNVINKGVELNGGGVPCDLMIETSGHGAVKDNYFLDDGAYMAIKIVIEQANRRLSGKGTVIDLLSNLSEPVEAEEFRLKLVGMEGKALSEVAPLKDNIVSGFKEWVDGGCGGNSGWTLAPDNHEGWRVSIKEGEGEGWILLRGSIHDPLCVLNVESDKVGGVAEHLSVFYEWISGSDVVKYVDVEGIKKYLGK